MLARLGQAVRMPDAILSIPLVTIASLIVLCPVKTATGQAAATPSAGPYSAFDNPPTSIVCAGKHRAPTDASWWYPYSVPIAGIGTPPTDCTPGNGQPYDEIHLTALELGNGQSVEMRVSCYVLKSTDGKKPHCCWDGVQYSNTIDENWQKC